MESLNSCSPRLGSRQANGRVSSNSTLRSSISILLTFGCLLGCSERSAPRGAANSSEHADHGHAHDDHEHAHGDDEHAANGDAESAHSDEVTLTPDAIEHYAIRLGTVAKRTLIPTFIAPAQIGLNPDAVAHVGCPVAGRVTDLRVTLGKDVAAGDVLFVVLSSELGNAESEFLQKRAAVASARPAVDLAKSAYDRAKTLFDSSQGIALAEVLKREAELRSAESTLSAAIAAEQAAENLLHVLGRSQDAVQRLAETGEADAHYAVVSPIAGKVIEREITLGELVGPDRDALLVIADLSKSWVLADVPESRLREVAIGNRARVRASSVEAARAAGDAHWCDGVVAFISPLLDSATRSARVRIDVEDRHPELRPGVFAEAEIETSRATGPFTPELAIPRDAVQNVEGRTVVFVPVPQEAGTFAARTVRVGRPVGGFVPVFSGVAEGDALVVSGSFILKAELGKSGAAHEH